MYTNVKYDQNSFSCAKYGKLKILPNHMKIFKSLLILFLFSSCSSLKYLDAFNGFENRPEKVESTTYSVKYIDSLPLVEMAFKIISFYDSKGRKIKSMTFKSDGSPSSGGWNYSYDKNGNEIQNTLYNLDSSINVQNNYKYNKFGQKIEREYFSDLQKSVTEYIHDRKNRICKIYGKKSDGSFKDQEMLKYDEKWRKKELISYDKSGKQKSRIEFFYNEKSNEIQSKWYNSENVLYDYYNSTYNLNNDRIRIDHYRINNGETKLSNDTKTEYTYDEHGNCVEERLISNGKISWITKNKFYF